MKRRLAIAALIGVSLLAAGCATGPKYAEVAQSFPSLAPDEGRIFFFRSSSMFGAAVQPNIQLNNVVVGSSRPGGFFYVDRPAGSYIASSATETEKTLSFTLDAGETKYIRSTPGFGLFVGRIILDLTNSQEAQAEIESLSFTGPTSDEK